MAQAPPGRDQNGPLVKFKKKRKRQKRRPIEAVPQDWERWDKAAKLEGLNWSEFARRALEYRARKTLEAREQDALSAAVKQW